MAVVVSLMERPVYTYPQVDRFLSLTGTAKRRLNGYRRNRFVYPPILRPKPMDTHWVTWGELVETRLFAGYRDVDNIPVQRMRRVVEVLRVEFDQKYPLAYSGRSFSQKADECCTRHNTQQACRTSSRSRWVPTR